MTIAVTLADVKTPLKDIIDTLDNPKFQSVSISLVAALLTVIFVKSKKLADLTSFSDGVVFCFQEAELSVYS